MRTYRDRVQRMRTRISALERESRSLHESLREEQRMAMIDALTGIPNRAAYDDRIEQEFKRWKRFARPVSILAWDIDRFKAINDAYGHKAGDKVLRVVGAAPGASRARHGFRRPLRRRGVRDAARRHGPRGGAGRGGEDPRRRSRSSGSTSTTSPSRSRPPAASPRFTGEDEPDTVFDRADSALYQAKEAGRNCCVVG